MTASKLDEARAATRGTWIGTRPDRAFDTRQLQRSRFVGLMKYLLPLASLLIIGLVVAWPQIYRHYEGFNLTFSTVELTDQRLRMINPRYQGVDGKGQPFIVTADSATQDPKDRKLVDLEHVKADMRLDNGVWGLLSANSGIYNQTSKLLHLEGNVSLYSDRGYEFHGQVADIDMNAGTVASNQPVHGQGPLGTVRSDRFETRDKGNRIIFIDHVKVRLFSGRRS